MPDSNLLPLFLTLTIVVTSFAVTTVILLIVFKQRQTKNRLERQRLEFQYTEDLLRTRMEVQEQALQTVSQEIHDGIGQELSMGRMQLSTLRQHITTPEGNQLLQENLDILKKSIKSLRLLSHSLNTGLIERKGLEEALQTELERLQNFTSLNCQLEVSGEHRDLSKEMDLLLFRVAQESIQNVVKHAGASNVTVFLEYGHHHVCLRIVDDGKGIATDTESAAGLGMTSMRQRADMLKGQLTVRRVAPRGTEVSLIAPYNT